MPPLPFLVPAVRRDYHDADDQGDNDDHRSSD